MKTGRDDAIHEKDAEELSLQEAATKPARQCRKEDVCWEAALQWEFNPLCTA